MDELSARASDTDREHAVAALREHVLAGRLTLEEFSERARAAYLVREQDDLAALAGPLPALPTRRRPSRLTPALLAHVVRRGRLRLARRAIVVAAFSDVDFDLREAEIAHAETDVHLLVAFGNVDVYVPEGIAVDVTGLTVGGHRREWGRDAAQPSAPVLGVRVLALFGTVDVWRVPSDLRGGYRELTKALAQGQAALPA
ncbi:MAG TPA: DUF1707 domain-containing protein [Gaiellaceae bacterium]|nr:DUF1707 domain-containing protein [Gaiellaceae bacterium]